MVNNIASLRSRVKERVRFFVERDAGFKHSMNNPEIIRENLEKFNLLYPNTFHCKVSLESDCFIGAYMLTFRLRQSHSPRRDPFENPEIGHCIGVLLFHGPNSVGMMYPEYFIDMPLTAVAFSLAMVPFFSFYI